MIPSAVQAVLKAHQLTALTFEPGSTPTSEKAAARINCKVGQIAKSMLFKGKDGLFHLFVCPGDRRVDNKKLKKFIGVKARMASAEETISVTGFKPGAVCPFGLAGINVYIDCGLSRYPVIYPAAGTNASGVPVTFDQLRSITNATLCDIMD